MSLLEGEKREVVEKGAAKKEVLESGGKGSIRLWIWLILLFLECPMIYSASYSMQKIEKGHVTRVWVGVGGRGV